MLIESDPQADPGPPMPGLGSNPQDVGRWLLTDRQAFATTLLVFFLDTYIDVEESHKNMACLYWHPTAIRMQLEQDFAVEVAPANFDKLMAAITLVTTNYFYKNMSRFNDLCNALVGHGLDTTEIRLPDALEMAWAISEALLLSPPDGKEKEGEPFCAEIQHFIGATLKAEGFIKPPDILRIAEGGDTSEQTRLGWSDDPEMYQAIWEKQADKAKEVNEAIATAIQELMTQIKSLPLRHGDVERFAERIGKDIRPTR